MCNGARVAANALGACRNSYMQPHPMHGYAVELAALSVDGCRATLTRQQAAWLGGEAASALGFGTVPNSQAKGVPGADPGLVSAHVASCKQQQQQKHSSIVATCHDRWSLMVRTGAAG